MFLQVVVYLHSKTKPQFEYTISFHTFLYSVKKHVEDIKVVAYLSDVMH